MPSLVARLLLAGLGLVAGGCADSSRQAAAPAAELSFPQDLFARVNGATLHYLDWGGEGDLLLLLPGWSQTAYTWGEIAPKFTDRFRVVSLTRRGHGASEKATAGFTLDVLVDDVVAFVDSIGASRIVLAGHSFAGREMPLVAARLGERVRGLVFLDAVYDWPALRRHQGSAEINRLMEPPDSAFASREALEAWYRWRDPETWRPVVAATLRSQTLLTSDGRVAWQLPIADLAKELGWMATTGTDYSAIRVPALAIWANMLEPGTRSLARAGYPAEDVEAFRTWVIEADQVVKRAGIDALKQSAGPVTVVELSAMHAVHWFDPDRVVVEMNRFFDAIADETR